MFLGQQHRGKGPRVFIVPVDDFCQAFSRSALAQQPLLVSRGIMPLVVLPPGSDGLGIGLRQVEPFAHVSLLGVIMALGCHQALARVIQAGYEAQGLGRKRRRPGFLHQPDQAIDHLNQPGVSGQARAVASG